MDRRAGSAGNADAAAAAAASSTSGGVVDSRSSLSMSGEWKATSGAFAEGWLITVGADRICSVSQSPSE